MHKYTHHWERSFFSRTSLRGYFVGNKFDIFRIKLGQTFLLCENPLNN